MFAVGDDAVAVDVATSLAIEEMGWVGVRWLGAVVIRVGRAGSRRTAMWERAAVGRRFMPHGSWLLASHVHLCMSSTSSMFVILSVSLPILLRNARNQKKKSIKIQLSSKLSPIRHSKHQSSPARLRIKVSDIKVTPAHHDRPLPPRVCHGYGAAETPWGVDYQRVGAGTD